MTSDVSQRRSLLGGVSYGRNFLQNLSKRLRPLTDLPEDVVNTMKYLLYVLSVPAALALPDWDAAIDRFRPFHLHCDASQDGFGATLERE